MPVPLPAAPLAGSALMLAPLPARVRAWRRETLDTVTLVLSRPRDVATQFAPGQFNMLYAFGAGEIPVSLAGDPSRAHELVHTIRAVGAVSSALCASRVGSTIGVRGPYGQPWPLAELRGLDILVIGGGLGLAPLRAAVFSLLRHRAHYGRLWLLFGARAPADLLYVDELAAWGARDDVVVLATVDHADVQWQRHVGAVPALLAAVDFDAARTAALVCGPEVMMRYTVRELSRRGLCAERIYLSLERNMECGVGLCGHCQLGPHFICKDGPVMSYARLRPFMWTSEL